MVSDDFSFPKMSYQMTNLAVTPSLWRISSTVYPADYYEESNKGELEAEDDQFSEKMDMLWEDFNEELQRVCSFKVKKKAAADKLSNAKSAAAGVKIVEVCFTQATGNSGMIYDKRFRKSAVLFIKFLKKLFSTTAAQIKKN